MPRKKTTKPDLVTSKPDLETDMKAKKKAPKEDLELEAIDSTIEVEVLSEPTKLDTDMVLSAFTDKDARDKLLRDETLEPHIHLALLIMIVFLMAALIMLGYSMA